MGYYKSLACSLAIGFLTFPSSSLEAKAKDPASSVSLALESISTNATGIAESFKTPFQIYDSNNDGRISMQEYVKAAMAGKPYSAKDLSRLNLIFRKMDTNRDGALDSTEYTPSSEEKPTEEEKGKKEIKSPRNHEAQPHRAPKNADKLAERLERLQPKSNK
jgi:hypothetical protein